MPPFTWCLSVWKKARLGWWKYRHARHATVHLLGQHWDRHTHPSLPASQGITGTPEHPAPLTQHHARVSKAMLKEKDQRSLGEWLILGWAGAGKVQGNLEHPTVAGK